MDAHHTAAANVIRHQPKVAIRGYKGENSITLPFLVSEKNTFIYAMILKDESHPPNTGVKGDIIEEPGIDKAHSEVGHSSELH